MRISPVVLALIASLSACGERAKPADDLEPISFLIDWEPGPTYIGVYYAKAIGAFERAGFEVTISWVRGAHESIAAVVNGSYPIATASGGATAVARSKGVAVKSLDVLYPEISTVIFGPASNHIGQPSDLEGKRVGIYPGSINNEEFEAFVLANGLDRSRISVVAMSGDDIEALLAGTVDAALNYRELSPALLAIDERVELIDGRRSFEIRLSDFGVHAYGLNLVASDSLVNLRPGMLDALAHATLEGYFEGCSHPAKAVEAFLAAEPASNRVQVEAGWTETCDLVATSEQRQSVEGWVATIAMFDSLGMLEQKVIPENVMMDR